MLNRPLQTKRKRGEEMRASKRKAPAGSEQEQIESLQKSVHYLWITNIIVNSKRYAGKLEHENLMLRIELDRLKRERDQAVEELHRNTDAVPVVRCKDCIKWEADGSYEFDDDGTKKL